MNIFKALGDFLLSSWIWQFTADWFHPIITGIVMFFMLRIILRYPRIQSMMMAISAQIVALGMLCLIALGVLVHMFGWEFEELSPQEGITRMAVFMPTIGLAILYAIFSSFFFWICSFFWRKNVGGLIVVSWLSNGIGAMVSYMCIRIVEFMQYLG